MNRGITLAGLIAACLVALCASSAWAARLRVAVLEIRAGQDTPLTLAEGRFLTDVVRGAALDLGGHQVLTRENMLELLPPDKRDLAQCEGECEVETGRNLGVDYVAVADVLRFGSSLRLSVRLYDTHSAALLDQQTAQAVSVDALEPETRRAAERLFAQIPSAVAVAEGPLPAAGANTPSRPLGASIVDFRSDPPGAVVQLDGRLLCAQTPCSKLVPHGSHQLSMEAEMHDRREARVAFEGSVVLTWPLKPNFALLDVESAEPGLEVRIDGAPVGTTPLQGHRVAAGGHHVEVDAECWLDAGQQLQVSAGDRRPVRLGTSPRKRRVEILPRDTLENDVTAELAIDGRPAGSGPVALDVPVCAQRLTATRAEGGTVTITVAELGETWIPVFKVRTQLEAEEAARAEAREEAARRRAAAQKRKGGILRLYYHGGVYAYSETPLALDEGDDASAGTESGEKPRIGLADDSSVVLSDLNLSSDAHGGTLATGYRMEDVELGVELGVTGFSVGRHRLQFETGPEAQSSATGFPTGDVNVGNLVQIDFGLYGTMALSSSDVEPYVGLYGGLSGASLTVTGKDASLQDAEENFDHYGGYLGASAGLRLYATPDVQPFVELRALALSPVGSGLLVNAGLAVYYRSFTKD